MFQKENVLSVNGKQLVGFCEKWFGDDAPVFLGREVIFLFLEYFFLGDEGRY